MTTWNVATWVVTRDERGEKEQDQHEPADRKRKRSMAYAVIEPMMTVPVTETDQMIAVLTNAAAISPVGERGRVVATG